MSIWLIAIPASFARESRAGQASSTPRAAGNMARRSLAA